MTVGEQQKRFTPAAFAALVSHSPILISSSAWHTRFPRGYERVDIRILEWIRRWRQQIGSR